MRPTNPCGRVTAVRRLRRRGNLPGTSQAPGPPRARPLWRATGLTDGEPGRRPASAPTPSAGAAPMTQTPFLRLSDLEAARPFATRHIGPSADEQRRMLDALGYADLDALLAEAVPASIREKIALALPPAATETEVEAELRALAARNQVLRPMIGLGYYGTITPPVIRRNVL